MARRRSSSKQPQNVSDSDPQRVAAVASANSARKSRHQRVNYATPEALVSIPVAASPSNNDLAIGNQCWKIQSRAAIWKL
ncbi:hypothetical protein R3P38DRAFT_3167905 [Favolaschia claudopus]|uniref:Uncharacterized protein n=1 Tax=Favolaschia claudopus TaxID=2862362 RepID=A0AAW0E4Y5_9AGAR